MPRTEIVVPSFGANSKKAKLVQWHVEDGTAVRIGESLATLETRKVVMDLECYQEGILHHIIREGELVEVGSSIGYLTTDEVEGEDERCQVTLELTTAGIEALDSVRESTSREEFLRKCLQEKLAKSDHLRG
ncbi:lipoyl domain-containing protein [Roseibacillus persicicus]|uniref:lipoyl domain-containing protein n=1 Tax=Roseibacillus persicicus TaxID=454148 RepID=UPI00280CE143|nr:lipoyl domain-containing protein [Roseibacillus persicicus]MDQ8191224.1 lipoyl domain-containing protein [Roseibacillus persicicus]